MSDNTKIPENGHQERRAVPRAKTLRQAVFSAFFDGGGLLRGTAVDISPNGIQIRTRHPERLGRQIEVELYPKSGDRTGRMITVRGRVVRVDPVGEAEYAMGVRFLMSFPASEPFQQPQLSSSQEALAALRLASEQLHKLDGGTPSPLAYAEHLRDESMGEVVFRPRFDQRVHRSYRIARFVSVLISSIILLIILWRSASCHNSRSTNDRIPGGSMYKSAGEVRDTLRGNGRITRFVTRAEAAAWARDKPPSQLLSRAQGWLAAGQPEAAEEVFKTLLEQGATTPAEEFAAGVGRAHVLAALGQRNESLALLADALASEKNVPAPWLVMGRQIRQAVARGDAAARIPPLLDALEVVADETSSLASPEDPGDSGLSTPIIGATPLPPSREDDNSSWQSGPASMAGRSGVGERTAGAASRSPRIEVSTSQYVLTVFRGKERLGEFPVGLGREGTTPHGEFRIANKIENPDWYDRGRVVKTGDPENPLGASWMGLGNEEGATSYGIHPTNEPESIGGNLSRGCIRMRPDDAAIVFAACPIGTPVRIGP